MGRNWADKHFIWNRPVSLFLQSSNEQSFPLRIQNSHYETTSHQLIFSVLAIHIHVLLLKKQKGFKNEMEVYGFFVAVTTFGGEQKSVYNGVICLHLKISYCLCYDQKGDNLSIE